jgi:hypothetical protein
MTGVPVDSPAMIRMPAAARSDVLAGIPAFDGDGAVCPGGLGRV